MIEFQLGTGTVSGGVPYLIQHVERVSDLVKKALDVQVRSSISADDAAEIGKSVCVRKLFIINLDRSCVSSIQCHNFHLLAADVETNLLCKDVKALCLLLNVRVCVVARLDHQRNPDLSSRKTRNTIPVT